MDIELVKQLKDSGFPQYPEDDGLPGKAIFLKGEYVIEGENKFYIPTLSELIEACGDEGFKSLDSATPGPVWSAYGYKEDGRTPRNTYTVMGRGKSPEEAVAKLYLELKKKGE